MRYNFPNDRNADRLFPEELNSAVLIHYLRHNVFDRHQIFAEQHDYEEFLRLPLEGSDAVFRRHVVAITGGEYPFP
jgi:hypothetical protein